MTCFGALFLYCYTDFCFPSLFTAEGINQITLYRFIVKGEFRFPEGVKVTPAMKDIIRKLLTTEPRKRLGSMAGGIDEIFVHKWFLDIDFAALRRREIQAPWLPEIKDPLDRSKFKEWEHLKDKTKTDYPRLSPTQQRIFETF